MASGYLYYFKGMLINPQSTLTSLKNSSLKAAFSYFLLVWGVFAVLFCLIGYFHLDSLEKTKDVYVPLLFVVTVLVGWLFFGLVIHIVLIVLSGPKHIRKTYLGLLYSVTPLAVIGWIPFIGGLSVIWALFLVRQAITEFHEISARLAITVIMISLFIGIAIFGIAFFSVFAGITYFSQ